MSFDDVIAESLVPDTKSVFVLGCLDHRVTVLAQQLRALNLVDAILQGKYSRAQGRIAVVGGGIAGVTAATALSLAAPGLARIDLFERKDTLLHLQKGSRDRFLHPYLYDWPAPDTTKRNADLPFLNWNAGPASQVQLEIEGQFDILCRSSNLCIKTEREVESIIPMGTGCKVVVKGAPADSGVYDVVILAIGFGYERNIGQLQPSYWTATPLAQPLPSPGRDTVIFISGNGDGGLVDFQMAAFRALTHKKICDLITQYAGLELAKENLLEIETRAWANRSIDIFQEYERLVIPVLPDKMLLDVIDQLRTDASVWFHTIHPSLFSRETAILNRFGAMLAIAADRNVPGRNKIHLSCGHEFVGGVPIEGPVTIDGQAPLQPDYRYLRFGTDLSDNVLPFKDLVDRLSRARTAAPPAPFRPATPELTATAKARFAACEGAKVIEARAFLADDMAPHGLVKTITLRSTGGTSITWCGEILLGEVEKAWHAPHNSNEVHLPIRRGSLTCSCHRPHLRACQICRNILREPLSVEPGVFPLFGPRLARPQRCCAIRHSRAEGRL
jgi:hypothetical protein